MNSILKRFLPGALSIAMTATAIPMTFAHAEEQTDPYPYTLFAASQEEGAITVNAGNFCVNGNVATNGAIVSSGNMNINGSRTENVGESMIIIFDKIDNRYFSSYNVDEHTEDYFLDELNININVPTEVQGEATLTGNININSALKALEDVNLYGEVKNTNDSVIFSKYGDIIIDSQNVNLNGLVYAPFGVVDITAQNLNLNNVVIIADSIRLDCPNVNVNHGYESARFVSGTSEPLDIPEDEWQYMKDENENGFPDFFENPANWSLLKDTDGDRLPDCVEHHIGTNASLVDSDGDTLDDYYEIFITFTDPTLSDTDNNGITDGNEDFDTDNLVNHLEQTQNTSPWTNDSDDDGLIDGDEVYTYHTNPLEPDTDFDGLSDADEIELGTNPINCDSNSNGIPDNEEKFEQTFTYDVENENCAIEQVIVSMECTGNIQNTTSIESMMDKDYLSTNVVGLVGEPFEINTTSEHNSATIKFKINKTRLNGIPFDNLLFLWYDKANKTYVEIETVHDSENSVVSIITNHFSEYMIVDSQEWFSAWQNDLHSDIDMHDPNGTDTILVIDCSGSMYNNDRNEIGRKQAAESFIESMRSNDRVAILAEDSSPTPLIEFTSADKKESLLNALDSIYSTGGNNFNASLSKCVEMFNNDSISTHRNIVFMSDGGCDLSDTVLDDVNEAGATVFAVGFGDSSWDFTLDHMASYTEGHFFKALSTDMLKHIYKKLGLVLTLDLKDMDKDGLYDGFEQSGMRVQNGQVIHTDNTIKDSDSDGLKDGKEIDPNFTVKLISNKITGENEIVSIEFHMNSNPENCDDTDLDGYADIDDPSPMDSPALLNGKYDFLDNEIYSISDMGGMEPTKYLEINEGEDLKQLFLTRERVNSSNQKFRFDWCGTGYKIHPLSDESTVLTVKANNEGHYSICADKDYDEMRQIWEVLPYNDGNPDVLAADGLVLRSKVLIFDEHDNIGKPLYLSYADNKITLSPDRVFNTRLKLIGLENKWLNFGYCFIRHNRWILDEAHTLNEYNNIETAFKNYTINTSLYPTLEADYNADSNTYIDTGCFCGQEASVFNSMRLGDCRYGEYCCGILGTYNGLQLVGEKKVDLCKLSFEFDVNAIQFTFKERGSWGTVPGKIQYYYNSHDIEYNTIFNRITHGFLDPTILKQNTSFYESNKWIIDAVLAVNPTLRFANLNIEDQTSEIIEILDQELFDGKIIVLSAWNSPNRKLNFEYLNKVGSHTVALEYNHNNNKVNLYNFNNYLMEVDNTYSSVREMVFSNSPYFSNLISGYSLQKGN